MTPRRPSSSNSQADARSVSSGQMSLDSYLETGTGPKPPRPETLRSGLSLSQHARTVKGMAARGTQAIPSPASRKSTDRKRREDRKKKTKVSVTLRCDPDWLQLQTASGLRAKYMNRQEDVFKLIVAIYMDDRRAGIATLVVNSHSDAQEIRTHSELIREVFDHQVEIIPERFHILSTDIIKRKLADRLAGPGANLNYDSLFEDLPGRLQDWCAETGLPLLKVCWRDGHLSFILENLDMALHAIEKTFSVCGIHTDFISVEPKSTVKQCYNCQRLKHMSFNCDYATRCGHCLGPHKLRECPKGVRKQCGVCNEVGHASYERSTCDDEAMRSARHTASLWRGKAEWETRNNVKLLGLDLTGAYHRVTREDIISLVEKRNVPFLSYMLELLKASAPQSRPAQESNFSPEEDTYGVAQATAATATTPTTATTTTATATAATPTTATATTTATTATATATATGTAGTAGTASTAAITATTTTATTAPTAAASSPYSSAKIPLKIADTLSTVPSLHTASQNSSITYPLSDVTGIPVFVTGSNRLYIGDSRVNKRKTGDHGDLSPCEQVKKVRLDLQGSCAEPMASEPEAAASLDREAERKILRPKAVSKPVVKSTVSRAPNCSQERQADGEIHESITDKGEEEQKENNKKKKGGYQMTLLAYREMYKASSSLV
ncbi:uncharacterized protein FSUBG_13615 [Fusarium subglutinans]|uniref:Uncharacterized protein n=1 Tax=Gibberella subglutinans TaxID=42677 RepID=A0A8H5NWF3_GIBSU|nr:uncharacterized protein FSUBG_13615 [Fusarium subglutinans]KAF5579428.1 hypothetical protein FSUBG_13615 [Fusarium subglutinans]